MTRGARCVDAPGMRLPAKTRRRPGCSARLRRVSLAPALRADLTFDDLASRGRLEVETIVAPLVALGLTLVVNVRLCELGLRRGRVGGDAKHRGHAGRRRQLLQHATP